MKKHHPDAKLFAALKFVAKQNCSQETFENEDAMHVIKVTIVVSRVSAHAGENRKLCLNVHGCLPRIKIPYVCSYRSCYSDQPLEMGYMGTYPGVGAWVYAQKGCTQHFGSSYPSPKNTPSYPTVPETTHFKS